MKKLIIIAFVLFNYATTIAQQVQVIEGTQNLSNMGAQPSLSIEVLNAKPKYVEKVWKDFMKQYGTDIKKVKKGDELLADNVSMPNIQPTLPLDLYIFFKPSGNNTTATMWIDLGGGWVSSSAFAKEYKESEKHLLKFAVEVARKQTIDELENQSDELKKLTKELDKLKSKNKDLVSDIENWKEKIRKAEKDIEQNKINQDLQVQKINNQQKVVDSVQKKLNEL